MPRSGHTTPLIFRRPTPSRAPTVGCLTGPLILPEARTERYYLGAKPRPSRPSSVAPEERRFHAADLRRLPRCAQHHAKVRGLTGSCSASSYRALAGRLGTIASRTGRPRARLKIRLSGWQRRHGDGRGKGRFRGDQLPAERARVHVLSAEH